MSVSPHASCSAVSDGLAEPLHGWGAKEIHHWLLVEDRSAWAHDAFASMPVHARETIEAWQSAIPHSKALGIRQKGRADGPLRLFVASTETRAIVAWELADLDALVELSADDLIAGRGGVAVEHSLMLVCTHGKHDVCCAVRGAPVFRALHAQLPQARAWQCTHVGAHRFAANVLALPSGILYGRVQAEHAESMVAAEDRGAIYDLSRYRGLSHLPRPVQFADAWLRARLELVDLDALTMSGWSHDKNHWSIAATCAGAEHRVVVNIRPSTPRVVTCGEDAKAVPEYEILEHHQHKV